MSGPSISLNQVPSEPSLKDLLDLLKKDILLSLNSHHIGTVQSFDPTTQTATATINYKKTFFEVDETTGIYTPVLVDYPILIDCPVICLGGGLGSLTFPIAVGDECLILLNDRDIDNWFQGSSGGPVASSRLHSISDALILVGLRSLANVLPAYDAARVVIKNDKAFFGVGPTLFKMENDTKNLKTILTQLVTDLQNLCTQINAIATTNTVPGNPALISPASQALISTVSSSIGTIATDLAGLLE